MPNKTYRRAVAVLGAAAFAAGCGGSGESEKAKLAAPFAYDSSRPLELQTRSKDRRPAGIEVRDVSFTAPDGRTDAYLVVPARAEQLPAVIYAHGALGDRGELLEEAVKLSAHRVVALTLDMAYSPRRARPLGPPGMQAVRARVQLEVDAVREIRRAVDLLRSLSSVDGDRIGYVGWSAGARVGAIVAGVEPRIEAFDLIAGGAAPLSEYLNAAPAELRAQLEPLLGKTDPLRYVGHAGPSALLFQNGRRDEVVPNAALQELARAGSKPKEVRWYNSGHVPSERIWSDSSRWLASRLDFSSA